MKHRETPDFWYHYRQLPQNIQDRADQCYELLKQNPHHPFGSLLTKAWEEI